MNSIDGVYELLKSVVAQAREYIIVGAVDKYDPAKSIELMKEYRWFMESDANHSPTASLKALCESTSLDLDAVRENIRPYCKVIYDRYVKGLKGARVPKEILQRDFNRDEVWRKHKLALI